MTEELPRIGSLSLSAKRDSVAAFFLDRPLPLPPPLSAEHDRTLAGLKSLAHDCAWGGVLELATSMLNADDDAAELLPTSAAATAFLTSANLASLIDVAPIPTSASASAPAPSTSPAPARLLPHDRLLVIAYRGLALVQTLALDRAVALLAPLAPITPTNPSHRYESFPSLYPSHAPGSFIPFELSVLSLELRSRTADLSSAIADTYALKKHFPQHQTFLTSTLIGYHLRAAHYDTAVDLTHALVATQSSSARALYLLARVLLHVGDIPSALRVVAVAAARPDATPDYVHVHEALALAAKGDHARALAENDRAVAVIDAAPNASSHVRVFAECNAATCLMQMGRLREGIARLEDFLRNHPTTALDEGVCFNLATMYDLAFPDVAGEKKETLQKLASRYGRQGFNLEI